MPEPVRLLTRTDLSHLLGVSLKTITKIQFGHFAGRPPLKAIFRGHRCTRFHPDDVAAWLAASAAPTPRRGRGRPRKYNPASGK